MIIRKFQHEMNKEGKKEPEYRTKQGGGFMDPKLRVFRDGIRATTATTTGSLLRTSVIVGKA